MSEKNALEQSFGKNEIKTIFGIIKIISSIEILICLVFILAGCASDAWQLFICIGLITIAQLVLLYITVKMFFSIAENLRRLVDNSNSIGQMLSEIKEIVKRGEGSEPK